MLQRLIAAVLGVLGLVAIGLGVASATVWRADDVLVATASVDPETRLVVTDPGVLEMAGDPVTVRVSADGDTPVVLAVGRDTDVTGWVGVDAHVRITGMSGWHELRTDVVEAPAPTASATAPAEGDAAAPTEVVPDTAVAPDAAADPAAADPAATGGADTATETPPVADPTGSDLWIVQETGTGSATLTWEAQPGRWSLVAASLGESAPLVELSWPRTVTTPWLWPAVAGGSALVVAGLLLGLRLWSRRHVSPDERDWHPVTTGPVPVAVGAGALVGAQQGDAPTVVLTRRQMRDAELAGDTRVRRRERPGRESTGEHPRVPDPTRASAAGRPESAPAADAPVPRWAAAAAAIPGRAPVGTPSAPEPAPSGPPAERPLWGRAPAPGHPSPEPVGAPGRPGPTERPGNPHAADAPAPQAPRPAAGGPSWAASVPARRGTDDAPVAPGSHRAGGWAGAAPVPGSPHGPVPGTPRPTGTRPDELGPSHEQYRTADPRSGRAPGTPPGDRASTGLRAGATWSSAQPVPAPPHGHRAVPGPGSPGSVPGPPGRFSHPDAAGPAGPDRGPAAKGLGPQPGGPAGPDPRTGRPGGPVSAPPRSAYPGRPDAPSGSRPPRPERPAGSVAPSHSAPAHHAAPAEAPAVRADAWRKAWGFPANDDGDPEQGPSGREGRR